MSKNLLFRIWLLSGFIWIGLNAFSQVNTGDEDSTMLNRAMTRDEKAVDDAVNGWWSASMQTRDQRIAWWREARFGMFVHWGIYSLPGGEWDGHPVNGYAEHLMRKEKIPRAKYLEIARQFNPVDFNADQWIAEAKKAGMRYFIITAKHHDGFAMYPSKVSDFNIHDQTPFQRDPMAELAAACKKYGLKFGFYYSHAFDWEHPDAPGNDWEYHNPGGDLNLYGGRDWYDIHPELLPKAVKYVNEKAIPQIRELIQRYHPDILWFDTPQKLPLSENIRILKTIREIDPDIVVNGRLARSSQVMFGDYKNTADRPAEFYPVDGDWEAIPTTNESYGYSKFDHSHKPAVFFIRLLAKASSRGGNLLMNIGPMGNGTFDSSDTRILDSIGLWMNKNGESIYGTMRTPLPLQSWGVSVLKGQKLYLHVFRWPVDGKLIVGGLKSNFETAYFLANPSSSKLSVKRLNPLDICISVPQKSPDPADAVIVLETSGKLVTDTIRLLSANSPNRLLAFDAQLNGKGFRFGDGKAKRYDVEGWNNNRQSLNWNFRLNENAKYNIVLLYAGSAQSGGTFRLLTDTGVIMEGEIQPEKNTDVYQVNPGMVAFPAGTHNIKIEPVHIKGAELMKILEVKLFPVEHPVND